VIGIGGIRMLNKDTHMPVSSVFAANIYFNQITEYGYTSKGVRLVVDEGDGGTHRSLEVITQSVRPPSKSLCVCVCVCVCVRACVCCIPLTWRNVSHHPQGIEIVSVIEDYVYYLREDSTHAKALSDYEVTDDRLLGFKKDEIISVTKKDANVRFGVPHPLVCRAMRGCRAMRVSCACRVRKSSHDCGHVAGLVDR